MTTIPPIVIEQLRKTSDTIVSWALHVVICGKQPQQQSSKAAAAAAAPNAALEQQRKRSIETVLAKIRAPLHSATETLLKRCARSSIKVLAAAGNKKATNDQLREHAVVALATLRWTQPLLWHELMFALAPASSSGNAAVASVGAAAGARRAREETARGGDSDAIPVTSITIPDVVVNLKAEDLSGFCTRVQNALGDVVDPWIRGAAAVAERYDEKQHGDGNAASNKGASAAAASASCSWLWCRDGLIDASSSAIVKNTFVHTAASLAAEQQRERDLQAARLKLQKALGGGAGARKGGGKQPGGGAAMMSIGGGYGAGGDRLDDDVDGDDGVNDDDDGEASFGAGAITAAATVDFLAMFAAGKKQDEKKLRLEARAKQEDEQRKFKERQDLDTAARSNGGGDDDDEEAAALAGAAKASRDDMNSRIMGDVRMKVLHTAAIFAPPPPPPPPTAAAKRTHDRQGDAPAVNVQRRCYICGFAAVRRVVIQAADSARQKKDAARQHQQWVSAASAAAAAAAVQSSASASRHGGEVDADDDSDPARLLGIVSLAPFGRGGNTATIFSTSRAEASSAVGGANGRGRGKHNSKTAGREGGGDEKRTVLVDVNEAAIDEWRDDAELVQCAECGLFFHFGCIAPSRRASASCRVCTRCQMLEIADDGDNNRALVRADYNALVYGVDYDGVSDARSAAQQRKAFTRSGIPRFRTAMFM